MKLKFFLLVMMTMALVACGSSKPQNDSDVPDFVLNPPKAKGIIYGTGISQQESAQLAKTTADSRARQEIAKVLSTKVSSMLEDFMGQLALGENAEVTESVRSVTRSMTKIELVGVEIEKREFIDGTMYSLAKYNLDGEMRKMIKSQVEKALTSKEALLSQFRAKQGFEALDKELSKLQNELP